MGGPARVKIFAWVMAMSAAELCALHVPAPIANVAAITAKKFRERRFTAHLPHPHRLAVVLVCLPVSFLRFSFPQVSFRPASFLPLFCLPASSRWLSFLRPAFSLPFRGGLSFPFRDPHARPDPSRGRNRPARRSTSFARRHRRCAARGYNRYGSR